MAGGQIGGQGGPIKRLAWVFLAACIAVAVLGDLPRDPQRFWGELRDRSEQLKGVAGDTVDWLGLSTDGSVPTDFLKNLDGDSPKTGTGDGAGGGGSAGKPGGEAAPKALADLRVSETALGGYDRDEWRHWDNVTSCWTVREQVLLRDAVPGTVTLLDRNGRVTKDTAAACEVAGGKWVDPYTKETFTNPSDLDIDHMVALGEAARSGGQAWSEDRKRNYANALGYPRHLWAVSASANRQKSDRRPDEWQPINRAIHCEYATAWVTVKKQWGLTVTRAEKQALAEMLSTC